MKQTAHGPTACSATIMNENHSPQTVLITGGAVRIGRQIAIALACDGYCVAVHYNSSKSDALQTVEEIHAAGGIAEAFQADLSGPPSVASTLCAAVRSQFGSLEVLINNASVFEAGTLETSTSDQWNRMLSVNLQMPYFLCQSFVAGLASDRRGQIINLCDWRGELHPYGHDIYTLTKAGMVAMTRMLARELAPRIRVNGINPGAVLPPEGGDEDHELRAIETIPLRRTGSPEDIVTAVRYLLDSPFVTGELLNVTGGEHLA